MNTYPDMFEVVYKGVNGESKKLRDIIDISRDVYTFGRFKYIFKKEAILKLRRFVGAKFLKPEFVDKPNAANNNGYLVICTVQFPDGEESFELGEANNLNTDGISRKFKGTMAFKRGYHRAFLSSDFMGLFDVYSEEEAEEFKQVANPDRNEGFDTESEYEEEKDYVYQLDSENVFIFPPVSKRILPNTDDKYPGEEIFHILREYKDEDYLNVILEVYPDNQYFKQTIQNLQNIKRIKHELTEKNTQMQVESFLNSQFDDISSSQIADNLEEINSVEILDMHSPLEFLDAIDFLDSTIEQSDEILTENTIAVSENELVSAEDTAATTEDYPKDTDTISSDVITESKEQTPETIHNDGTMTNDTNDNQPQLNTNNDSHAIEPDKANDIQPSNTPSAPVKTKNNQRGERKKNK